MRSLVPKHLGDLLVALCRLGINDPDGRRRVGAMLGFDLIEREPATPVTPLTERTTSRESTSSSTIEPHEPPGAVPPSGQNDAWVERSATVPALPAWFHDETPFPRDEIECVAPPVEPLLRPEWLRALLSTALASQRPDGDIDLDRLVERFARGEALDALPQLPRSCFDSGVQVLIDTGETMRPFASDQADLVASVRRLVAHEFVDVQLCAGCPQVGSTRESGFAEAYRFPASGVPVLVLTDLGAISVPFGQSSRPSEWLRFAQTLRSAGSHVVAFVPCRRERVPERLRRVIAVVSWDHVTTVRDVKHSRESASTRGQW